MDNTGDADKEGSTQGEVPGKGARGPRPSLWSADCKKQRRRRPGDCSASLPWVMGNPRCRLAQHLRPHESTSMAPDALWAQRLSWRAALSCVIMATPPLGHSNTLPCCNSLQPCKYQILQTRSSQGVIYMMVDEKERHAVW